MITGFVFAGFSIAVSGGPLSASAAAANSRGEASEQTAVQRPAAQPHAAPRPDKGEPSRKAIFFRRVLPFVLFGGSGAKRDWGRFFDAASTSGEAPQGAARLAV